MSCLIQKSACAISDLNFISKTVKLLAVHVGEVLQDIGIGDDSYTIVEIVN